MAHAGQEPGRLAALLVREGGGDDEEDGQERRDALDGPERAERPDDVPGEGLDRARPAQAGKAA